MAQDDPGKDISYTRPIIGVPSALDGLNSTNNTHHNQDCEVSTTFPGGYVVTISGGIDILAAPPMKGFLLQIDARASVKDITVAPTTGVVPPGTPLATVLAGTYSLCVSDGVGWAAIPDTGTFANATFPSALARGAVDANQANLAAFAVTSAATDGITYGQGDIVVLFQQTAPAENGPYVVGAVAGGFAPLTRPSWWATGSAIPSGFVFLLSKDGTKYGGLPMEVYAVTGKIVGTDDPALLFQWASGTVNAAGGAFFQERGGLTITGHPAGGRFVFGNTGGLKFSSSDLVPSPLGGGGNVNITFDVIPTSATACEVQVYLAGVLADVNFGFYVRTIN